ASACWVPLSPSIASKRSKAMPAAPNVFSICARRSGARARLITYDFIVPHNLVVTNHPVAYHRRQRAASAGRRGEATARMHHPKRCPKQEAAALPALPLSSAPLVTVVLPFRNAAATLADAVRSIEQQTLSRWRLLLL